MGRAPHDAGVDRGAAAVNGEPENAGSPDPNSSCPKGIQLAVDRPHSRVLDGHYAAIISAESSEGPDHGRPALGGNQSTSPPSFKSARVWRPARHNGRSGQESKTQMTREANGAANADRRIISRRLPPWRCPGWLSRRRHNPIRYPSQSERLGAPNLETRRRSRAHLARPTTTLGDGHRTVTTETSSSPASRSSAASSRHRPANQMRPSMPTGARSSTPRTPAQLPFGGQQRLRKPIVVRVHRPAIRADAPPCSKPPSSLLLAS